MKSNFSMRCNLRKRHTYQNRLICSGAKDAFIKLPTLNKETYPNKLKNLKFHLSIRKDNRLLLEWSEY